MKKSLLFYLVFLLPLLSFAQKSSISGVVTDANSGETLIGATILYGINAGVITDMDGKYYIKVDQGTYHLKISYVGYLPQEMDVTVQKGALVQNFQLKTPTLNEVEIVGDIAKTRETPIAFTSVAPIKLAEELASRDIPMLLNKTPGVYATQSGGGDGDARINIRGFSQRNLAVMLDGIPVNDMENGWVYWSNWFGLDMVTRNIQVQRGLSASKLALPAVGGLMNIITKGIDANPGVTVKQEVGSDGFLRTSLGATTGLLKHGWGITLAGSYKQGDGWVDNTWTKGWFFFLRVDKRFGKHTVSFTAMGAPQEHAQRPYTDAIATFDRDYAKKLGISDVNISKSKYYGLRYNPNWGYLNRWTRGANGEKIDANTESLSQSKNYFFKPQISLRDLWRINAKLYWSNILYTSIGHGGGTNNFSSNNAGAAGGSTFAFDQNGQVDYQSAYDYNMDLNGTNPTHRSEKILRSSVNNHYWYGLLSTLNWEISPTLTFSGGLDLRTYKGEHYGEVYDLLGGEYMRDDGNKNINPYQTKYSQGDKIYYYNDALVRWGGIFAQLEFKKGNWSAFINLTTALSAYKRIDYFKKKDLVIDGNLFAQAVGFGESFYYNGTDHITYSEQLGDSRYTSGDSVFVIHGGDTLSIAHATEYNGSSAQARNATTKWKLFTGFTFKGGVNYNIDKRNNVFLNVGYLSKAPRFQNVFDNTNAELKDIKNEIIKAVEVGYSLNTKRIALNVNGYLTFWYNKPLESPLSVTDTTSQERLAANINGMDALHKGIEIEFGWKPIPSVQWDQVVSWGDWKWTSKGVAIVKDEAGNTIYSKPFDAKGVHVGDAAQFQFMESIRWEIIKSLYISGTMTYFGKNFAQMDPATLQVPRESWQLPDYYLVDLNAGYRINLKKIKFDIRASILNLFDRVYITDAKNNDTYVGAWATNFDASSASVFFGMGRRYNVSLAISY